MKTAPIPVRETATRLRRRGLVQVLLLGVLLMATFPKPARAQDVEVPSPADFDVYGGYRKIRSQANPNGADHFAVEKLDGQWWFITPEGNAFFKLGVACVTLYGPGKDFRGKTYQENAMAKYGKTEVWAQEITKRLRGWGFNTFDQYSGYVEPWFPYMKEKMAFILTRGFARHALGSKTVGNLLQDLNCRHAGGGPRVFPDVFDPAFETFCGKHAGEVADKRDHRKWILGVTMDEADDLFGFGGAGGHPHLGWAAAQVNPAGGPSGKIHTKQALADFLKTKYGTIAALNAAWGTAYTGFGSEGGWGKGAGLLDEDGRNLGDKEAYDHTRGNWGRDYFPNKTFKTKALEQDLDDFLEQISRRYFSVTGAGLRAALPGVPLIAARGGPDSRVPIIRGAKDHIDVFCGGGSPKEVEKFYAVAGKPVVGSFYGTANKDSAVAGREKNVQSEHATQPARGEGYRKTLESLAAMRAGTAGEYPYVGCMIWCLFDAGLQNWETGNFGLVTVMDNAYDGREARKAAGKDAAGRTVGGEEGDYGDFVSAVREANRTVYVVRPLVRGKPGSAPAGAGPAPKPARPHGR